MLNYSFLEDRKGVAYFFIIATSPQCLANCWNATVIELALKILSHGEWQRCLGVKYVWTGRTFLFVLQSPEFGHGKYTGKSAALLWFA